MFSKDQLKMIKDFFNEDVGEYKFSKLFITEDGLKEYSKEKYDKQYHKFISLNRIIYGFFNGTTFYFFTGTEKRNMRLINMTALFYNKKNYEIMWTSSDKNIYKYIEDTGEAQLEFMFQ